MRVQVNNPIAVGPTNAFGEIPVVVDGGANASVRTARGGVIIRPTDFNPERVFLDDTLVGDATPLVQRRRRVHGAGGRRARLQLRQLQAQRHPGPHSGRQRARPGGHDGARRPASSPWRRSTSRTSAPTTRQSKFDALADQIVNHLLSPDVIALEEIQDNNGATNDGVVDANVTLDQLVAAIAAAGGPAYEWRQINPVNDQDGGAAGRQHPRRASCSAPTAASRSSTARADRRRRRPASSSGASGPQLSASPGRIDPANTRLEHQPQAAGRRVHLPRRDRVRDRQPLQLQGRRRPAVRSLPAADAGQRGAAAPAGPGRQRLRRLDPGRRRRRQHRRARRHQRLRLLRHGVDPEGRRAAQPDGHVAAGPSATATCSRATRRCSTRSWSAAGWTSPTRRSIRCTSTPSSSTSSPTMIRP